MLEVANHIVLSAFLLLIDDPFKKSSMKKEKSANLYSFWANDNK
jgi:hypothetical protein